MKAAIIGLPQKGCQEIEGICYDPQIPQMAQITISSRGLGGLRDLLILRITYCPSHLSSLICAICAICGFVLARRLRQLFR
jgi:hypothetical protein